MDDTELFLRYSLPDNFRDVNDARAALAYLRELLDDGRGVAGFLLASIIGPGILAKDDGVRELLGSHSESECMALYERSFPLLVQEAERGSLQAMNFLSLYYQRGIPPAPVSIEDFRKWDDRAKAEWAKRKP